MAHWIFATHAEVLQALLDPNLLPPGQGPSDNGVLQAVRSTYAQALRPEPLALWRSALAAHAMDLVDALPTGTPVDLLASYAQPWSVELALQVTGAVRAQAGDAVDLAARIFNAAACSSDGLTDTDTLQAATELASMVAAPAAAGPLADVQTFVALTQTLPALLVRVWQVLLSDAAAWATVQRQPQALARVADELLRLGSPSRAVFRQAAADTSVGGHSIHCGDRVTLRLDQANRDPARYVNPEGLDASRQASGHLGLGGGLHPCAGAALVRMALIVASEALLPRLSHAAGHEVPERGGFAISGPTALWAVLAMRRG